MSYTREYKIWNNMIQRCTNPKHNSYEAYRKLGVKVCKKWTNSFSKFYSDVGPVPKGMQIDRKDNTKGYYPGNIRIVSNRKNMQNTSVSLYWVVDRVQYVSLNEAARVLGVARSTVNQWRKGRYGVGGVFYKPKEGYYTVPKYPQGGDVSKL